MDREPFEWDIATTQFSQVVGGYMSVQVDLLGAGATAPTFRTHYPYGFFGRPRDPDVGPGGAPGTGCTTLYALEGNRGHAFPLGDPRLDGLLPESPKGSSGMAVLRDDGKYSVVRLGGDDGAFVVMVQAAAGDCYLRLDGTNGFDVNTPWGRLQMGPLGVHIKTSAGAKLDLGSIGGFAVGPLAPLAALSTYAKLSAGITTVSGGVVNLGVSGGIANEAATTALATSIAANEAVFVALDTLIASLVPLSGVTPAQQAAVAAALATAATANATAAALAPAIGKVV